jgi:hypothetical protein
MLLDGLRDELAELEISIAHHQSCLKRLEGRKAAVHEQLANFTYPVLTLPPEIFLRCIPPHHYYPIFSKAPLILLQICKAWHALALFIPALWTDLDIDIKHQELELEAAERLEQFIRTWFARGGSIPRSFRFTGELDTLNAIIYDHAAHFGDLHLFTTMSCFLSLRGGAPFPMLREMEIEDICGTFGEELILGPNAFLAAPQLRTLGLICLFASPLAFPWHQLTKFVASRHNHEGATTLSSARC